MKEYATSPRVTAWVIATLVPGLLLSALAAWRQADINQQRASEVFAAESLQLAAQLTARMQTYEYGLRGARGAVLTAGEQGISVATQAERLVLALEELARTAR